MSEQEELSKNSMLDIVSLIKNKDVDYWIKESLKQMTPERLKECITTQENFVIKFFDTNYLNIPGIRSLAKDRLHNDWKVIEHYLLNPINMKESLEKNDGNWGLLETDIGSEYINWVGIDAYEWLREFVYREKEKVLEILEANPVILFKTLEELCSAVGISQERYVEIMRMFGSKDIINIYVELSDKHRK